MSRFALFGLGGLFLFGITLFVSWNSTNLTFALVWIAASAFILLLGIFFMILNIHDHIIEGENEIEIPTKESAISD